jgi:hypothetical protein
MDGFAVKTGQRTGRSKQPPKNKWPSVTSPVWLISQNSNQRKTEPSRAFAFYLRSVGILMFTMIGSSFTCHSGSPHSLLQNFVLSSLRLTCDFHRTGVSLFRLTDSVGTAQISRPSRLMLTHMFRYVHWRCTNWKQRQLVLSYLLWQFSIAILINPPASDGV